ncbi:hypothetical protein [Chryseobacterium vrystaatense]|uniref:Uncharacterized protein n=1 Tax=Chryseobacterium vrystaatense TaxID=307480 RepID=A0A1M4UG11_9FLAO|nr:hypothetical protein [Chryseobacterium vrystaatense]SHE55558.1 hypothetical protein SAMN02787073_0620 [Chryseobacterium vrystaatense]
MKNIIISILCSISISVFAQKTPLEISKLVLSNRDHREKYQQYIFENRDIDLKYEREKNTDYSLGYREFNDLENYKVVDVTATDKNNGKYDFYLYFVKVKNEWKMFDAQKLPDITFAYVAFTKGLTEEQIDAVLKSKEEQKPFTSRAQFNYIKSIYDLGNSSDDELIEHFTKFKSQFNALKDEFIKFRTLHSDYTNSEKNQRFENDCQKLTISEINEYLPFTRNTLAFVICNMENNAVGYFYAGKNPVTAIDPGGMLFIREIGEGWYLFKMKNKKKS